ncbi:DgyrCDS2759 [Dimorphilus gyrociliatus]|uniref:DgyrCDS2759 n=1 Tax=Dimorphilus gyrociliatus TaxID=2664684 RepID=A0A7I8VEA7_9ANNE|nr:DgyrCDS2759 [Dimorphilus gyrociliatus]
MAELPRSESGDTAEYLAKRRIPELFQYLTAALVFKKPDSPVDFLIKCVEKLKAMGDDNIFWDTFIKDDNSETISKLHNEESGDEEMKNLKETKKTSEKKFPLINEPVEDIIDSTTVGKKQEEQQIELSVTEPEITQATAKKSKKKKELSKLVITDVDTSKTPVVTPTEPLTAGTTGFMLNMDDKVLNDIQSDEETEDTFDDMEPYSLDVMRILRGDVDSPPFMPSNVVRIFLSSTFTDFKAERNILPQRAYPELRNYCSNNGLDFQVADMRWGVTQDMVDDHQVTDLCLMEIENCQKLSVGPAFVTLIGNRYGFQPFPHHIESTEFSIIKEEAKILCPDDVGLLDDWFKECTNTIPPVYVLQPITSRLEHYNNLDSDKEKERAEHIAKWQEVFKKLRSILRQSAQAAFDKKLLDESNRIRYFLSVTENEIERGLLNVDNADEKSLCYVRELHGLKENIDFSTASRFIDIDSNKRVPDNSSLHFRTKLATERIPLKLQGKNIREYKLAWDKCSLEDCQHEEHGNYLKEFSEHFINDLKTLIEKKLKDEKIAKSYPAVYQEALHHSKFANTKCEVFFGREEEIEEIREYILRKGQSQPLVVCAPSGFGKTALLAHIVRLIPKWESVYPKTFVIHRFLGTSASSSSVLSTLKSLVEQICVVFKIIQPPEDSLQTMSGIRFEFQKLIAFIKKRRSTVKLVIILDSIDQLNNSYGAHSMAWLPKMFPKNVKVIISVLSENTTLVENVRRRLNCKDFVSLRPLSANVASDIITAYLEKRKKTLTEPQRNLILKAFEGSKQPLFLKLSLDYAKTWHSYDPIESIKISETANEAIKYLFDGVERKNGKLLVARSMGYLTCGRQGLSPIEVEDALSCDDEVLNDVYRYHDPPLEDVVRIPSLLWSRIQHDLREYLAERMTDGKTVLAWYHRQFLETAFNRYVKDREIELHSKLSEIYIAESGIRRSIQLEWRNKKLLKDADRQISHQPTSIHNIRKLNSLPYHLLKSNQLEQLKEKCLLNFNFLSTKLKCQPLYDICQTYDTFLDVQKDIEVSYMKDFLQLSYGALLLDPSSFPHEILKRLYIISQTHPGIASILHSCKNFMQNTSDPVLVPINNIRGQGPESPLKFSRLIGSIGKTTRDFQTLVALRSEITSTVTQLTIVNSNREQVATIDLMKQTLFITTNNCRYLIYAEMNKVKIYELDTGDSYKITKYCEPAPQDRKITVRCITITKDDSKLIMGIRLFEGGHTNKSGSYTSRIFVVDLEEDTILHNVKFKARKHIEKCILVKEEKWLLTISHDMIYLYDLEKMEILYEKQMIDLNGSLFDVNFSNDSQIIGALGGFKKYAKILIFDCETKTFTKSELTQPKNVEEGNDKNNIAQPLAVNFNNDASTILIVSQFKSTEKKPSYICKWNRKTDEYSMELLKNLVKSPTSLISVKDFTYCLIGFQYGAIIILSIESLAHIRKFKAHNHTITSLSQFGDNSILSMGQDQYMKIWDIDNLLESSPAKGNIDNQDELNLDITSISAENIFQDGKKEEESKEVPEGSSSNDDKDNDDKEKDDKEKDDKDKEDKDKDCNDKDDRHKDDKDQDDKHKDDKDKDDKDKDDKDIAAPVEKKPLVIREKLIDVNEDFLKLTSTKTHIISLPSSFPAGLRFWNFDGTIDEKVSYSFTETYQQSLENNSSIKFKRKPGANVTIVDKYFIVNHFIRDEQSFYISFYDTEASKWTVTAHKMLQDSYFNIIYNDKIYLMREGLLEIYSIPNFDLIKSINIHSLKMDLPTFDSSGSKRKLSFYKIGITEDERFFIISVPMGQIKKYFDLIDIEEGHSKRYLYTQGVNYRSFDSGTYYLCCLSGDKSYDTISIGLMRIKKDKMDYVCKIYSGRHSNHHTKLGSVAHRNNKLILYETDNFTKKISLKGHAREVTDTIIFNNGRNIITYSVDNTVRLWNIETGQQICSYNAAGSVESVEIINNNKYIVVSSYNGPMKKKATILEMKNILSKQC